MTSTSIEWTDRTWNPVRGCTRVSEGCRNCYAERLAARNLPEMRSAEGEPFAVQTPSGPRWTGAVELFPEKLEEPAHWRKPQRVFVNSMSDLFHEQLSFVDVDLIAWMMAQHRRHTFQVLTKRPERMLEWARRHYASPAPGLTSQPYPNVWLGVSVEDQATADARIPLLLETPAAVRFVSAEPLLGHLDLSEWLGGERANDRGRESVSGVRGDRCVLCGRRRPDLETPAPDRGQPHRHTTLLEGPGGAESRGAVRVGRVPDRDVLGRPYAPQGVCPSCGLDAEESGGHTARHADQPQERVAAGFAAGQLGARDALTERGPRHPGAGQEAEGPARSGQRLRQAGAGTGSVHTSTGRQDGAIEDRGNVRHQAEHGVGHPAAEELGAPALARPHLDWVICGGESGPGARPFDLAWMRSIVAQCRTAGVPAFCKQIGSKPFDTDSLAAEQYAAAWRLKDRKGGDPAEWPEDLRVREFPS